MNQTQEKRKENLSKRRTVRIMRANKGQAAREAALPHAPTIEIKKKNHRFCRHDGIRFHAI